MRINSRLSTLKAVTAATPHTGKNEKKDLQKNQGTKKIEENAPEKLPLMIDKEISLLLTFHDNSLGHF